MKIGVVTQLECELYPDKPIRSRYIGSSHAHTYMQLYPSEFAYLIDYKNPNKEFIDKSDIVFYHSGTYEDKEFRKIVGGINKPIVMYLEGGIDDIVRLQLEDVFDIKYISSFAKCVMVGHKNHVSLLQNFVDTEVVFSPLPYPIDQVGELLWQFSFALVPEIYDVVIPYGVTASENTKRNSYMSLFTAENFIDHGYSSCILDTNTDRCGLFLDKYKLRTKSLHFRSVFGHLELISRCKVVLNLDYRKVSGRNAIDSAMCNKIYIGSKDTPNVDYLYGGCDVFDQASINSAVDSALKGEVTINKDFFKLLSYDHAREFLGGYV